MERIRDPDRLQEERQLRAEYLRLLARQPPFVEKNDSTSLARTWEEACVTDMSRRTSVVQEAFLFEGLKSKIPPEHQPLLENIYVAVSRAQKLWVRQSEMIKLKWRQAPHVRGRKVKKIVKDTAFRVNDVLTRRAIAANIALPPDQEGISPLEQWQAEETGLRERFLKLEQKCHNP